MARHPRPHALVRVSDHALLRFLDRAGGLDVESLRAGMEASFARAVVAARRTGACDFVIVVDGLSYVVRNQVVVTVLPGAVRPGAAAPAEGKAP